MSPLWSATFLPSWVSFVLFVCLLTSLLACLFACLLARIKRTFKPIFGRAWLPDASGCSGQRCLGQQLLPLLAHIQAYFRAGLVARCFRVLGATVLGAAAFAALNAYSSLFSGWLGCQMLQGARGNGAWGSTFFRFKRTFQAYFRAGCQMLGCSGQRCLGQHLFPL